MGSVISLLYAEGQTSASFTHTGANAIHCSTPEHDVSLQDQGYILTHRGSYRVD